MPSVTVEQWAVIRAEGAGHIEAVSHSRDNAILAYVHRYALNEPGFSLKDWRNWWKINARKKNLVCQKIQIVTEHIPSNSYNGWTKAASKPNRCEWDTGKDTICAQQCASFGKHVVDGHRLCGLHLKSYQRHNKLLLVKGK